MTLTNYHTHTARCKHASGTERDYLDCAVQNGYRVLGFTDHMAWPYPNGFDSPIRMDVAQLDEYAATVLRMQTEYAPKIRVQLGAECEYYPDYLSWLKEQKQRLGLEYLLLGVHYPPNEIGFEPFANATAPDALLRYTELTVAGMESGLFAALCHPDLPLKSYPRFDRHAQQMSESICAAAKRLNMPLEYNLAGVRLRGDVPTGFGYTSEAFWQIAAGYGCTAIIASDAHAPEVLENTAAFTGAWEKLCGLHIPVLDFLPGLGETKGEREDGEKAL